MRIVAAVAIAALAMLTVVYASNLTKDIVRIKVSSSENGVLYVFALFPDGFREIAKFRIRSGEQDIAVNIAELKRAWAGSDVARSMLLVAVADGKIAVSGDGELRYTSCESCRLSVQPLKDGSWTLTTSREVVLSLPILSVAADSSWGYATLHYTGKAVFDLYARVDNWMRVGEVLIETDGGAISCTFDSGSCTICMDLKLRYEEWTYSVDGKPAASIGLAYVRDVYPETLKATDGSVNVTFTRLGIFRAETATQPYFLLSDLEFERIAVDASAFAEAVGDVPKILTMKLDGKPMFFDVLLYSYPNSVHEVLLGKFGDTPTLYIRAH